MVISQTKRFAKGLLQQLGLEIRRLPEKLDGRSLEKFIKSGRVPWLGGPTYDRATLEFVQATLADDKLMQAFRSGAPLPHGFGIGISERCVEYPWLFAHLTDEPGRLLDAGSILNHDCFIQIMDQYHKRIHILTLAPEHECFWTRSISYLYEDLRNIPARDDFYDVVVCISTLEHVGSKNDHYIEGFSENELHSGDYLDAVTEMGRVLRPGGSFFLTVPFGRYKKYESFQLFDSERLSSAIDAFGPTKNVQKSFYRYSSDGWNVADESDCIEADYVPWVAAYGDGRPWPDPIPREADLAAAARAVACVPAIKAE
jgi:SAM-dependent methyltransferase